MQHVKKYKGKHTKSNNCPCHQLGKDKIALPTLTKSYDKVNYPKHYKSHPSGIECIEIVRHMNFNRGNAIKYIWRAGKKEDEIYDLAKAIWYLKDEIERIKKGN